MEEALSSLAGKDFDRMYALELYLMFSGYKYQSHLPCE